jgi:hypothetical protein
MQEATMQVSKWGDSLAVRLPKALVEQMGLKAGDDINIVDVVERMLVAQKEEGRPAQGRACTPRFPQLDPSSRLQIRSGRSERAVTFRSHYGCAGPRAVIYIIGSHQA